MREQDDGISQVALEFIIRKIERQRNAAHALWDCAVRTGQSHSQTLYSAKVEAFDTALAIVRGVAAHSAGRRILSSPALRPTDYARDYPTGLVPMEDDE